MKPTRNNPEEATQSATRCPHSHCMYAFPHTKGHQALLREHLATVHTPQENQQLNQKELHKLHVYQCPHCPLLYATLAKCTKHIEQQHPLYRQLTNTELISHTYPSQNQEQAQAIQEQWLQTLHWLTDLQIQPPAARHSIYHKLCPSQKLLSYHMLHHIMEWCNKAILTYVPTSTSIENPPEANITATPFWKLLLIFESIILAPPTLEAEQHISYTKLLQYRQSLLRNGNLQPLYDATRVAPPSKPLAIPLFDDLRHNHQAQCTADQDNLHTAFNRIKSTTPTVTLTPQYLDRLQQLYPSTIHYDPRTHQTRTTESHTKLPEITQTDILRTLRKQKRGTASGPFASSIDLFRDYATYQIKLSAQRPYLQSFTTLITHIATGQTPSTVKPYLVAQYVIALHKDPEHLEKIRPIGIGTALRRLTAATLMTLYGPKIAAYLLPQGQYAIATPGGLDFICHATQAQLERYMPSPHNTTRILLTLDIENMFNAISRQACRTQLIQIPELQPLVPFFDTLYAAPNNCWHKTPANNYANFPQNEGFTQGCPLSGAFADIVLNMVLQPLNTQLTSRMQRRHELPATTLSYHDDTSIVIPFADLSWFLHTFHQLGEPLGIRLNFHKTKLLTSLSDESPMTYLSPADQQSLHDTLQLLGPQAEVRQGIRLLGQPIGSQEFATRFTQTALTQFQHIIAQQLMHRIQDHQTQTSIIKNCLIPSLTHLLAADVYHHYNTPITSLYHWSTTLTQTIDIAVQRAIAEISHTTELPVHAIPIIHLPVTLGGLGLRDPAATAIPSVITTFTRTLHYATHGISTTPIPSVLREALLSSRYNIILTQLAPLFLPQLPRSATTPVTTLAEHITMTSLPGLQQHFYHAYQHHIHDTLLQHPPPQLQHCIHSLLSPLTSIPLLSLSRRTPSNRLPNPTFRLLLQRKLRLPILPPHLQNKTCICRSQTTLDEYGDHFFSCTSASKIPLHNTIRNTLFHVLQIIAPLANISLTRNDIHLEPPNLIPSFPLLRPADIGIQLIETPKQPKQYLAIDVTVTATPKATELALPQDHPVPSNLIKVHENSAKLKFNVPHAPHLLCHDILLLPFTIDHLGGIGPHAHKFLYGTHPPISFSEWSGSTFPTNPAASQLASTSTKFIPKNILQRATHAWSHGQQLQQPFGHSYHTRTPTNWATQALALNVTLAFARHLHLHLEALNRLQFRTTQKQAADTLRHFPPFYLPPPPFLFPTEISVDLTVPHSLPRGTTDTLETS